MNSWRKGRKSTVQPNTCLLSTQGKATDSCVVSSKAWSCVQPLAYKHVHFRVAEDNYKMRKTKSTKQITISYYCISLNQKSTINGPPVES